MVVGKAVTVVKMDLPDRGAELAPPGVDRQVLVTNGACGNLNPPFHGASRDLVFSWGKSVADAIGESLLAGPSWLHQASIDTLP